MPRAPMRRAPLVVQQSRQTPAKGGQGGRALRSRRPTPPHKQGAFQLLVSNDTTSQNPPNSTAIIDAMLASTPYSANRLENGIRRWCCPLHLRARTRRNIATTASDTADHYCACPMGSHQEWLNRVLHQPLVALGYEILSLNGKLWKCASPHSGPMYY